MPPYVVALREAWRRSGLSAAHIAARADVSEGTVYLVLAGRRRVRVDSVLAVANALGVNVLPVSSPTSRGI